MEDEWFCQRFGGRTESKIKNQIVDKSSTSFCFLYAKGFQMP